MLPATQALLDSIPRPSAEAYRIRPWSLLAPGQAGRRLLIYVVLGTFLAALYRVSLEPHSPLPMLARRTEVWVLEGVIFVPIVVLLFVRAMRLRRSLSRFNEALPALVRGELDQAATELEALCRDGKNQLPWHALFVGGRAAAFHYAGKHEEAIPLLGEVIRSGWLGRGRFRGLRGYYEAYLAATYALLDRLEPAKAWREEADALLLPQRRPALVMADGLIALREKRFEDAASRVESSWKEIEEVVSPPELKGLRILRAFALSKLPATAERTAEIDDALENARPLRPGQLDHLAARWPELGAFLRGHGLSS